MLGFFMFGRTDTPRGIRNNNAGNLRDYGEAWRGKVGTDAAGFVIFDTPENGIRAMARVIINYGRLHGINTIRGIIYRYAPPNENDTESYISHVSRALGISPDEAIAADQLPALLAVMITHENGIQPYSAETIAAGVAAAWG